MQRIKTIFTLNKFIISEKFTLKFQKIISTNNYYKMGLCKEIIKLKDFKYLLCYNDCLLLIVSGGYVQFVDLYLA